jgi:hypothetical protein
MIAVSAARAEGRAAITCSGPLHRERHDAALRITGLARESIKATAFGAGIQMMHSGSVPVAEHPAPAVRRGRILTGIRPHFAEYRRQRGHDETGRWSDAYALYPLFLLTIAGVLGAVARLRLASGFVGRPAGLRLRK